LTNKNILSPESEKRNRERDIFSIPSCIAQFSALSPFLHSSSFEEETNF
jgi:hypothetical protein